MGFQQKAPEGKKNKDAPAPSRVNRGLVHHRGANPARTYFTNHTTGACVDKGSYGGRQVGYGRDAGWGIARKDAKFAVFRRVYIEVDGVLALHTLAILRGRYATVRQQQQFGVDQKGERLPEEYTQPPPTPPEAPR